MNYLSHGYRFLDDPLFMAGTVVPDWLSVVNRKVRARSRLVKPVVESTTDDSVRRVGLGILQHHDDDYRFHGCQQFMFLETALSQEFRKHMPDKYDHRPGFLGHITVELMLDSTIEANNTGITDRFYQAMNRVNAHTIEYAVNKMATRQTDRLAWFIDRFREEQFLYDYATDNGMMYRLNQVLKRVNLPSMPTACQPVFSFARELLHVHAKELLSAVESPTG